jgi:hypothetical protein
MKLFDSLKSALGLRPFKAKEAPRGWCREMLGQLETGAPVEAVARGLRGKWLEGALENEENQKRLSDWLLPAVRQKYPDLAPLCDLILGGFASQDQAFYTDALYQRARDYLRRQYWPVEASLFLANYLLMNGFQTHGHWFVVRELGGAAGPFMAVELHRRYLLFGEVSHRAALAEGDDALGHYDGVAAAELACEHYRRARALTASLADRLEPHVGKPAAAKAVVALGKVADERLEDARNLLLRKALDAGPDFAAVARCQPGKPAWDAVIAKVRDEVAEQRCRQSDPRFYPIDLKAHKKLLEGFARHVRQIANGYDGYLPLLELKAEIHALNDRPRLAAEAFNALCRKRPQSAYYPYRAGLAYRAAGDVLARRFLVHASRRSAGRWCDELAAARAAILAYEYEGAALREVFPEKRAECAGMLAARLEAHWNNVSGAHWDLDTAAPLALRAAHLRHLAYEAATGEDRDKLREAAVVAYDRVGLDGDDLIARPTPEDVFDPIQPMTVSAWTATT